MRCGGVRDWLHCPQHIPSRVTRLTMLAFAKSLNYGDYLAYRLTESSRGAPRVRGKGGGAAVTRNSRLGV